LRHERPGNLISCGRNRLGRELNVATEAKRNPATLPGGDNTVSPPRHNLLTPLSFGSDGAAKRNQTITTSQIISMCYDRFL